MTLEKKQALAQAEEQQQNDTQNKPTATEEAEEDLIGGSPLKDLVGDNVKEVLQNKENKFIYFYRKSKLDLEEFNKVSEFAAKIENGMRVIPYKIDLD